jgi:hypothetical protein
MCSAPLHFLIIGENDAGVAFEKMLKDAPQFGGVSEIAVRSGRVDVLDDHARQAPLAVGGDAEIVAQLEGYDVRHMLVLGDGGDLVLGQSAHPDAIFDGQHEKMSLYLAQSVSRSQRLQHGIRAEIAADVVDPNQSGSVFCQATTARRAPALPGRSRGTGQAAGDDISSTAWCCLEAGQEWSPSFRMERDLLVVTVFLNRLANDFWYGLRS